MRLYKSPKEQGTDFLFLKEHKFPNVLLDHGAQTQHPQDKVTAGGEVAGPVVTWDIRGRDPGD